MSSRDRSADEERRSRPEGRRRRPDERRRWFGERRPRPEERRRWFGERRRRPDDRRVTSPLLWVALFTAGVLLLLLLFALVWRGFGSFRLPWARVEPTRELILGAPTAEASALLGGAREGAAPTPDPALVPPIGAPPGPPAAVSPTFEGFYFSRGGERMLGLPLGPPLIVNGREIQWFERGRLEHWPEHFGTPYEVQLGRLGVEFTQGREFARQAFFVSAPELRYFPETGHGVGGLFLRFWEQNGGVDLFGLPISEAFDEVLADGVTYRVQYFERVRLEYHPQHAGTMYEVQIGRLGAALMSNEARPDTVQPVPTQVPLP